MLASDLMISEFMATHDTGLKDQDGAFSDWIEIHNRGFSPIDLNGWYLTDSNSNLSKWRFPSVTVPADGYMVVFASSKDRQWLAPNCTPISNLAPAATIWRWFSPMH